MPVDKQGVVRIVNARVHDKAERTALLFIAGAQQSLWEGLEDDDVLDVLKQAASSTGSLLSVSL